MKKKRTYTRKSTKEAKATILRKPSTFANHEQIIQIVKLHKQGLSHKEILNKLGLSSENATWLKSQVVKLIKHKVIERRVVFINELEPELWQ